MKLHCLSNYNFNRDDNNIKFASKAIIFFFAFSSVRILTIDVQDKTGRVTYSFLSRSANVALKN